MGAAERLDNHDEQVEEALAIVALGEDDDGGSRHSGGDENWLISYADLMTLLMGFFALLTSMATFDSDEFSSVGDSAAQFFGGEVERPNEELGKELSRIIQERNLQNQVQITVSKTEVRLNFEGTLFFDSGSVALRDGAVLLMDEIISILGDKASEKKFFIEGHTDDVPISRDIVASNWELSSLRASAVARLFERHGFGRDRIMTIGLGETRPILPNSDEKGIAIPENQAKNRRVILRVLDKHPL